MAVESANPGGAWDYHDGIIAKAEHKPSASGCTSATVLISYNRNVMRDDMHDWVVA